jgi:hypothetical protein
VGGGKLRLEPDRLVIVPDRAVVLALGAVKDAAIVVGNGILRIAADQTAACGNSIIARSVTACRDIVGCGGDAEDKQRRCNTRNDPVQENTSPKLLRLCFHKLKLWHVGNDLLPRPEWRAAFRRRSAEMPDQVRSGDEGVVLCRRDRRGGVDVAQ